MVKKKKGGGGDCGARYLELIKTSEFSGVSEGCFSSCCLFSNLVMQKLPTETKC